MDLDYDNDPATEAERGQQFDLYAERSRIERDIRAIQLMQATTPLELESQKRQLAALRSELDTTNDQLSEAPRSPTESSTAPVSTEKILTAFVVGKTVLENEAWWKERMRNAKRYKLKGCRGITGKAGKSSTWYPDQIAAWLIDTKHMGAHRVAAILRQDFADCADAADRLEAAGNAEPRRLSDWRGVG